MKIKSIKIEGLFEIFNYDISFSGDENLLIITGPNGFGKTMTLNIIFNLFNKNFLFFQGLNFKKVDINIDGKISIIISKKIDNEISEITFNINENSHLIDSFSNKLKLGIVELFLSPSFLSLEQIGSDTWVDNYTGKKYTFENLINIYIEKIPQNKKNEITSFKVQRATEILDSIKVHLIKEQRLYRKLHSIGQNINEEEQTVIVETIQTYSKELRNLFGEVSLQSYRLSQELDGSYPNRLITEKGKLSEDEYNHRFNKLKEKQDTLINIGIYQSKQEVLAYSDADAKALLVYLKDFEKKIGAFDELLEKLDLFTTILNERRFTFKSIFIDRDKGFYFKTSDGKELELYQLSSGEQHEVVLLYELIFNAQQNTLVLIDEPEISLHVTWQKEFLKDLLKIIALQKMQVIVATHSPTIINDRWDLVYNLEKIDAE